MRIRIVVDMKHLLSRLLIFKVIPFWVLLFSSYSAFSQSPKLTHDESGRLTSSTHDVYNHEGMLAVSFEYTYNEQGVVETRTIIGYDKYERHLSTHTYTCDDELIWYELYRYDRHGNLTKRTQVLYEGGETIKNVYTYRYKYNSDGTWSSCRYYLNNNLYHTVNH